VTYRRSHNEQGITLLEIMVVLAIMAALFVLAKSGFRLITKADLVEDSSELAAIMKRTNQLAIEHGDMHRIVFDLDKNAYVVEVCQGAATIARNELVTVDKDKKKEALDKAKDRLTNMPEDAFATGDPDEATKRELALAGQHVADRECVAATDTFTGDAQGKGWARMLRSGKGIKFKQIYVQHRDDPVTKGQVALYFFPAGQSEKAIIELTDGSEVFSIKVYGLTSRVELVDGTLKDPNDHMLKNVMGDKDAKREDEK
jgi:general secretion pathway protein H